MLVYLGFERPAEGTQHIVVRQTCIDSRQATAESLFVALKGERTDGHAYVANAFSAGASLALVERPIAGYAMLDATRQSAPEPLSPPLTVLVPNTLAALQRIAHGRRAARPDLRVAAVTGSVGKTTTKEIVAAVLARRYRVLKSAGNLNNEIGLPLTLLSLEAEHQCAVLEMGMYDLGEIAALCRIAEPQIGVVTNVGPTHLERLGTIERIAQAKAELAQSLPDDGVAVLNGDDARVRAMQRQTRARVVTYGLFDDNTVYADDIVAEGLDGAHFTARVNLSAGFAVEAVSPPLRLRMLGQHAIWAALPAIAVGLVEGLSWDEIARGLWEAGQGLRLMPKRGLGGVVLLDDCYNASPASNAAALDVLAQLPGRHVAVLGDMYELGAMEAEGHRQVGRACAKAADVLVTVGERARLIAEGAREGGLAAGVIHSVADNASAIALLRELCAPGDAVLIKGSRGMAMEAIVNALEEPKA